MRWWTRSLRVCLVANMGGLRYKAVKAGFANVEHILAMCTSHEIAEVGFMFSSWSGCEAYTKIWRRTWYGSDAHA